jgi:CRP/FNR family nitrogen fixation transcriptional regulator
MTVEQSNVHSITAPGKLITVAPGLALPGYSLSFEANEEIFGEGESANFVYKVLTGAVRTTHSLGEGRRQIGGFHLPGDVFGLEWGATHRCSAEAIAASEVALVRRSALDRAAARDGDAARQLWSLASRELASVQDHVQLLGHKNPAERVGGFLLKLSKRAASATVELPMSRGDIGDHLGLTLETVSRTMRQLAREQAIALPSARRVVLRDTAALAAAA